MLRALRGYQALHVTMLLVVNYLLVKACLYSNDRFVDSILSLIDLMRSILNVLNNALKPTT